MESHSVLFIMHYSVTICI